MAHPAKRARATLEDFQTFEGAPDTRYELFDGEILAMNQGTLRHGVLQASLMMTLGRELEGRCTLSGPVGVYCEATGDAFGPDLVVLCEPPRFDPVLRRALTNPSAIFESLSPSTSQIDGHEKLHAYKTIASLREYVLVSQKTRLIYVHRRTRSGWAMEELSSGTFLVCDGEISVDAIYERIEKSPVLAG
jgi:Uma2 family endonuclease